MAVVLIYLSVSDFVFMMNKRSLRKPLVMIIHIKLVMASTKDIFMGWHVKLLHLCLVWKLWLWKNLDKKVQIYKEISEFLFAPAKPYLSGVSVSGKFAFVE